MEGVAIVVHAIERGWHVAVALVAVSGSVLVAQMSGLPELEFFRAWGSWATIGMGTGTGIVFIGTVTRVARRAHSACTSRRTRIEAAMASHDWAQAADRDLELAKWNLATLGQDEQTALLDALKRHPFYVEILECGPSQSLINKDILRTVGEGSGTNLICKVHPWLAMHRNALIRIIEGNRGI